MLRAVQAALADAEVRIAVLEAELAALRGGSRPPRKTADNSSLPPAKGFKARRPDPAPGTVPPKRGPKPGHPGVSRARVPAGQVPAVPLPPAHLAATPRWC